MHNFTQELLMRLDGRVPDDLLKVVAKETDMLMTKYDISKKETAIIPYVDLPECYKAFLLTKKVEGKSDATLKVYKFHLDFFFEHLVKPIEDLTQSDMVVYLYNMQSQGRNGKPLTATSTENIRLVLSTFFSWAYENEYIKRNPMKNIHRIQGEKKQRNPIKDSDIEKIRDAMEKRRLKKGMQKIIYLRDRALFELMLSTGARVSEVSRLNISDIDFDTKEVRLFGKGKKHRKSYMNAKAIYHLQRYLDARTDNYEALFISHKKPYHRLSADGIEGTLARYNNVDIEGTIYPHRLRHTMATNAVNHGMPLTELQTLLGHEKADTTLIYAHICDEQIRESHRKYVV